MDIKKISNTQNNVGNLILFDFKKYIWAGVTAQQAKPSFSVCGSSNPYRCWFMSWRNMINPVTY